MSKAQNLADLGNAYSDGALSNRNMIINGDFQVWQRGTTGTAVNGFGMSSADRWYAVRTALNQEVDSYGNPYAHCIAGDYADSTYVVQKVEQLSKLVGKQLTLSFKIKSDDGLGANGRILIRYYSSANTWIIVNDTTFTFDTSWGVITKTFDMGTVAPKAGYGLEFFINGDSSATNNNGKSFDLKEVQLELGDTATPFEHRSYGDELARCQRYFRKFGSDGAQNYIPVSEIGATQDNYRTRANYLLSPEMRVTPTLSFNALELNNMTLTLQNPVSNVSVAGSEYSRYGLALFFHTAIISGQAAGQPAFTRVENSDNGYLYFDAEL